MAGLVRRLKQGIDYYPLDCYFIDDIKVRKILHTNGAGAIAVLIDLLGNIYRDEGYYMKWDDDICFLVADKVGTSEASVQEIVRRAVHVDFFDGKLFEKYQILTSRGIQGRFVEATKRRKETEIYREFNLINDIEKEKHIRLITDEDSDEKNDDVNINSKNVYRNKENVDINSKNVYKEQQSKVKERKVKESRVNQSKVNNAPAREEGAESLGLQELPFFDKPSNANAMPGEDQLRKDFEEIWQNYPKRTDYALSFEYYCIAIEQGVTNEEIKTGVDNYAKLMEQQRTDYQFITFDKNFFRKQQWKAYQEMPGNFGKYSEPTPQFMKEQDEPVDDQEMDPVFQAELEERMKKLFE